MGIELALADVGITYCPEARVARYLQSGELREVLPEWSPIAPAMYLYYPRSSHCARRATGTDSCVT